MHLRCRLTKNSPRRIRSGTDAAGSKLQQVFRQKNLSLDSVHGRTLSNMPAGVFYTLLASALSISKRNFKTDTDVRVHSLAGYLYRLFSKGFFSQYTTHLLRRIAKSVHPCTLLAASFGSAETSLLISPAASVPLLINAQRIISAMDGGAYMQHRVCYNKLDVQKYTRTYIFERACALFSANSL